jgi:hypothetical protein
MDIRFHTCHVRSLYRVDAPITAAKEISRYKLNWWEYRRPDGQRWHQTSRKIYIFCRKIGFSVVDWIGLAQDRYRWRALVNTVMKLRVP